MSSHPLSCPVLFASVLLLLPPALLRAQEMIVPRPQLAGKLEKLFGDGRAPKLACGVVVGWATEKRPFFELQSDAPLIPASNEKVLTAGAAVLLLGMQHEIKTELIGHGPVEAGVLKGALRVRGEGDPTFGARDHGESLGKLTFFAERLLAQGVTRIGGDLIVDDSAFDQEFTGPDWPVSDARTTPYLAQVAALSLDDGCVRVMVTPGAVGRPASVSLVPDVGHVKLANGIGTSAGKEGGLRFERADGSNEISATGSIARGSGTQRHEIAIHDPAMNFGRALLHALKAAGIAVDGTVRRAAPEERKGGEVLLRYGTPLARILPAMLKESLNARAEMLFKHVGFATGNGGTFTGGATAVKSALAKAGIEASKLVLADGSGLSRKNRVTAGAIEQLLVALHQHPAGPEFRESLAEPGEEGTLRRRFLGLENRVFAKTGTLNGVSSLSGYVLTKGQKWIAFSILMNGTAGDIRKMQDNAVEMMAADG
jgi:serine-type D-Ala-D-Ala carboxypeptidase/endopeptidase (penicillin-binding protein 4)